MLTPEQAHRAEAAGKGRLTLARVETELGPLATIDDAMRRLDKLNVWIASGLLTANQGSASVRAVQVWIRSYQSRCKEDPMRFYAEVLGTTEPAGYNRSL